MRIKLVTGRDKVTYVYSVEPYRDTQGRPRQRTVASHGRLTDLLANDPDALDRLKASVKEDNQQRAGRRGVIEFDTTTPSDGVLAGNLGWLLVDAVITRLGIIEATRTATRRRDWQPDTTDVLRLLVASRVAWPGSKLHAWQRHSELVTGPQIPDWHRVYPVLDHIAELAPLLQKTAAASVDHPEASLATIDYDVTNYYFAVDYDDPDPQGVQAPRGQAVRMRGHSKESRPDPIIQMGLFADRDGIPICYRLFDGNINDQSTLHTALPEFKTASGYGRVVVVADKAMNTRDNLGMLHQGKDGWIVSMSVRSAAKTVQDWALDPEGWTITARDDDGQVKAKIKSRLVTSILPHTDYGVANLPVSVSEKQVIRWSADAAARDKRDRADMLAKAERLAADPGRYKASNRRGIKKYITALPVDPATGEILAGDVSLLKVDKDKATREALFDGYQGIRTSETTVDDQEIIDRYKQLWRIEDCFKVSKTGLCSRPVFVRTRAHIEAHFAICFLALLITRLLVRWTGLSSTDLLESLRRLEAIDCGRDVYRIQRPPGWGPIDDATGAGIDQSWATIEQIRAWRRDLSHACKTTDFLPTRK